jgi:hypothetical protein
VGKKVIPVQALGILEGVSPQTARKRAHEDGKVSPTHRQPLPPRKYSCYSFVSEAEWTTGSW